VETAEKSGKSALRHVQKVAHGRRLQFTKNRTSGDVDNSNAMEGSNTTPSRARLGKFDHLGGNAGGN